MTFELSEYDRAFVESHRKATNTLPTKALWTDSQAASSIPSVPTAAKEPLPSTVAFGARLRELRAQKGISQDALADATDIHSTAIGRLERGAREPRLSTILRLADGLGVEPGELIDPLA